MKCFQFIAVITVLLPATNTGLSQLASLYSFRATCEYRTFKNTVAYTLPVIGGFCRCPGFSPGVSFVTYRGQFSCVEKCYQSIHKTECKSTMKSDSKKLFSSCCTNTCNGILVPNMPYTEYKGNKAKNDLGCAAPATSPSPTPLVCPYNAFTNEYSFDPPVVGGYCRCTNLFGDRFTPGISFPVSRPLYPCALKCMNQLQDTDCKRNIRTVASTKFRSCCTACGGTTTQLAYFEQRRNLLKRDLGCLAPPPQRETLPPARDLPPSNNVGLQFSEEVNAGYLAEVIREELVKIDPTVTVKAIPDDTLDAFLYVLDSATTSFSTLAQSGTVRMFSSELQADSNVGNLSDVLRIHDARGSGSTGTVVETDNKDPWSKLLPKAFCWGVRTALTSKKGKKAKNTYNTKNGKTIVRGRGSCGTSGTVRIASVGNGVHYIYVPFNAAYRKKNGLPEIPE